MRVGDAEITVLKGQYSTGLQYQQPAAGHVYVAFDVRMKAVSGSVFVSIGDWTALSDGSNQGQSSFVVNDAWSPNLTFDQLRQGATTEGWITFEVPRPTNFVRLVYDNSLFANQTEFTLDMRCCT